jgi:hypothetical protein
MKCNLLLMTLVVLTSTWAHAAQLINCKFADPTNTDHVVIALLTGQIGTLSYNTGPQDVTTNSADGTLAIKRGTDAAGIASFNTQVEVMQMSFKMPVEDVSRIGVNFKATLHTAITELSTSQDQDLNCGAI